MNAKIKILVAYHKPAELIKNEFFVPIHAGRALLGQPSKDGSLTIDERQWMLNNTIGDDSGDNISCLNRQFSEMTAVYWAWKNREILGEPEYIGLSHYKRQFDFTNSAEKRQKIKFWPPETLSVLNNLETINAFISRYDICAPYPLASAANVSIIEAYQKYRPTHISANQQNFINALAIIGEKFPHIAPYADECFYNNKLLHYYNMFVMKWKIFEEYCDFIFSVLFAVNEKIDYSSIPYGHAREMGYLAERLTGLFLYMECRKPDIKYTFMPIWVVRSPEEYKDIEPAFDGNYAAIFFACFESSILKYIAVTIRSLLDHASKGRNYDIIVCVYGNPDTGIYRPLQEMADGQKNISLRLLNVERHIDAFESARIKQSPSADRTLAAKILSPDIFCRFEKILYLSCNLICQADIAELFDKDINDKLIGGCYDFLLYRESNCDNDRSINITIDQDILLLNLRRMRNNGSVDILNNAIDKLGADAKYHFADLLRNFEDEITFFESNWNNIDWYKFPGRYLWQQILTPDLYFALEESKTASRIIHFAGLKLPVHLPNKPMARYFWSCARRTPYYEDCLAELARWIFGIQTPLPESHRTTTFRNIIKKLITVSFRPFIRLFLPLESIIKYEQAPFAYFRRLKKSFIHRIKVFFTCCGIDRYKQ